MTEMSIVFDAEHKKRGKNIQMWLSNEYTNARMKMLLGLIDSIQYVTDAHLELEYGIVNEQGDSKE